MGQQHAADRVRSRIREWLDATGHGSRQQLAKQVHGKFGIRRSASWVSDITRASGKKIDVRLRDLDEVAEAMGVPPGNLVRRSNDYYEEVTPTEMRLLKWYRTMPHTVRAQLVVVLDYLFSFHDKALQEQTAERQRLTEIAKARIKKGA